MKCEPTDKLPKDANPADLARQYLELEGVRVSGAVQLDGNDRTLYVALSPPPQRVVPAPKEVPVPGAEIPNQLLEKIYGTNVPKLSTVTSAAIKKEWMDAHKGEEPTSEYVIRETMKRAGQALGVTRPPSPQTQQLPRSDRRRFVQPLLEKKGWSINDWATNSDVDFHTADGYIKGKTTPYPSTRAKLAKSLGVTVDDLPK